jgi:hypothetical protein
MNDRDTELAEMLDKIGTNFEKFKASNNETIAGLKNTVEKLETKLARPGAFPTSGNGDSGAPRMLKTQDGRELPFLRSEQKLADMYRGSNDDGFSIGEFCRSAMLGSKEGKAASGPALVPTGLGAMVIDRVRANTVIVQAGAGTIVIDGPTNMARLTGDPTVYQHTEGAADIVESDITAEAVSLNPKLLAVLIPLTTELVSDSPNLDAVLTTSLTNAFAAKLDALSIAKILADANLPKSAAAHDPAVWAKVMEAIGAALALNQDLPLAHISTPANFIARASQLASTAGSWLGKPPALAGMRELFTSSMTADQAIFGDFASAFAIAMRQELRVEVVRHAKPTSASHLLVAHMRADGVMLQPGRLFWQKKVP